MLSTWSMISCALRLRPKLAPLAQKRQRIGQPTCVAQVLRFESTRRLQQVRLGCTAYLGRHTGGESLVVKGRDAYRLHDLAVCLLQQEFLCAVLGLHNLVNPGPPSLDALLLQLLPPCLGHLQYSATA